VTIVEFLTARYDEWENVARRTYSQGAWRSGSTYGMFVSVEARSWTVVSGEWERSDADHIALNDPAYVLADIAAKRAIVELAEDATGLDAQVDSEFRVGRRDEVAEPYVGDLILRALAQPYAEHPDYDPAWRMS
jgi:hypothetical protein